VENRIGESRIGREGGSAARTNKKEKEREGTVTAKKCDAIVR